MTVISIANFRETPYDQRINRGHTILIFSVLCV